MAAASDLLILYDENNLEEGRIATRNVVYSELIEGVKDGVFSGGEPAKKKPKINTEEMKLKSQQHLERKNKKRRLILRSAVISRTYF